MVEKKGVDEQLAESSLRLQSKLADLIKIMKDSQSASLELNNNVMILTKKMDAVLEIFESATDYVKSNKEVDPFLARLDDLTKQNKDIARALVLIERSLREQSASFTPKMRVPQP